MCRRHKTANSYRSQTKMHQASDWFNSRRQCFHIFYGIGSDRTAWQNSARVAWLMGLGGPSAFCLGGAAAWCGGGGGAARSGDRYCGRPVRRFVGRLAGQHGCRIDPQRRCRRRRRTVPAVAEPGALQAALAPHRSSRALENTRLEISQPNTVSKSDGGGAVCTQQRRLCSVRSQASAGDGETGGDSVVIPAKPSLLGAPWCHG